MWDFLPCHNVFLMKLLSSSLQLDSRSFFFDVAPGAESGVSGFISLLAAASALKTVIQEAPPSRTIFYTFFQGVSHFHTTTANIAIVLNVLVPILLNVF